MKKRIFIAINLPDSVKEKLREFEEEWKDFPCRWVKPENIHLTLYFLGYVEEENIPSIVGVCEKVVGKSRPFSLTVKDTIYGPTDNKPRMIWVRIENSQELVDLQRQISRELRELPFYIKQETRPFRAHLTLCRFNSFDLKKWSPPNGGVDSELPDIHTEIQETFTVSTVEVMESKIARGGAEYFVVKSVKL